MVKLIQLVGIGTSPKVLLSTKKAHVLDMDFYVMMISSNKKKKTQCEVQKFGGLGTH